ncbi:hypothetical protein Y032_0205g1939 [Ancylostoma ceylanicum]|uniref:Uncharacterized protein n=1 Tax=Ancylostoma ceylanicum TaxID=53326 RepID=A0A016SMF6_9BILA|nr:hypothetical protein Y032_0205g1939 [Ancylostoma ceylanicum]
MRRHIYNLQTAENLTRVFTVKGAVTRELGGQFLNDQKARHLHSRSTLSFLGFRDFYSYAPSEAQLQSGHYLWDNLIETPKEEGTGEKCSEMPKNDESSSESNHMLQKWITRE